MNTGREGRRKWGKDGGQDEAEREAGGGARPRPEGGPRVQGLHVQLPKKRTPAFSSTFTRPLTRGKTSISETDEQLVSEADPGPLLGFPTPSPRMRQSRDEKLSSKILMSPPALSCRKGQRKKGLEAQVSLGVTSCPVWLGKHLVSTQSCDWRAFSLKTNHLKSKKMPAPPHFIEV